MFNSPTDTIAIPVAQIAVKAIALNFFSIELAPRPFFSITSIITRSCCISIFCEFEKESI